MGFFKKMVNDKVLDLRELAQEWATTSELPLIRDNLSITLALVDCRLCMSAEHAVLFDKNIWGSESCKVSYGYCLKYRKWVSETQGSGLLGKSHHVPSKTRWSTYDPKTNMSTWNDSSSTEIKAFWVPGIEFWLLGDFKQRVTDGKLSIAESIMKKKDPEWQSILNELLRVDPL